MFRITKTGLIHLLCVCSMTFVGFTACAAQKSLQLTNSDNNSGFSAPGFTSDTGKNYCGSYPLKNKKTCMPVKNAGGVNLTVRFTTADGRYLSWKYVESQGGVGVFATDDHKYDRAVAEVTFGSAPYFMKPVSYQVKNHVGLVCSRNACKSWE